MAKMGKRYRCDICGTEILSTKNTDTIPECCGQEMTDQEPPAPPDAD